MAEAEAEAKTPAKAKAKAKSAPDQAGEPAIALRGVGKHFGKTRVLESIDLEILPGELCVFVGPSGCGKSTLLRIISGLERGTSGDLFIFGRKMNDAHPSQRGIAMVFQSYALYPNMTVYQNLEFGLQLPASQKDEKERRIREAARMLQIDQLLQRRPHELSGGQRQRVAIGRALTRQPKIFLFDEPLSNLDAALRVSMRAELTRLHKQLGTTMVYVTHDQVEAMTMADRLVVLNGGHIEQSGPPLEVYQRPRTLFSAGFLGSPRMNFLTGAISDRMAEGVVIELTSGGAVRAKVASEGAMIGDQVTVGVRPEHIQLQVGEDGPLAAKIALIEDLGDHAIVHLDREGVAGPVLVRVDRPPAAEGAQVRFTLPPAEVHVFGKDGLALPKP
ncbi:MAG TPA: sn-glycerol-3-phosphate ABC transporter ATP-binding protein UgpC [Kofleriaceae bacterium]|nr:sn-glycerol-3-phosphate ABC transporter ATP-binding protein UgpC [Kofleriaceae bacterium]